MQSFICQPLDIPVFILQEKAASLVASSCDICVALQMPWQAVECSRMCTLRTRTSGSGVDPWL